MEHPPRLARAGLVRAGRSGIGAVPVRAVTGGRTGRDRPWSRKCVFISEMTLKSQNANSGLIDRTPTDRFGPVPCAACRPRAQEAPRVLPLRDSLLPTASTAAEFREELRRVRGPTRAEAGCLRYQAFESVRGPAAFAVHSEWVDEAAFEAHSRLPHTVRFVGAAERLLGRPVQGLRARPLDGGPEAPLP